MGNTLYIRHRDGATHALRGAAFKRLLKAVREEQAGPEVTNLVLSGYVGFLATNGEVLDWEHLTLDQMVSQGG